MLLRSKREFHKKNKTKLLETYSYYNKEGRLLSELQKILNDNNVKFKEADYLDIYNKIYENANDRYFKEFKKLIISFIGLFKSNEYNEKSEKRSVRKECVITCRTQ